MHIFELEAKDQPCGSQYKHVQKGSGTGKKMVWINAETAGMAR